MKRLLLALLLVLAPFAAEAETCTFNSGASTWSAVATVTGAGVAGCTPSADDHFVVASGAVVTITGSITQDGATAATGINVQSGGSLTVDTAGVVLTLNDLGLDLDSGGTLFVRGRALARGAATLLTAPSTTDYYTVGDLAPCDPGGGSINCATDPTIMRLDYPSATYDEAAGTGLDLTLDTGFAAVVATDWIVFFDPDTSDLYRGADSGYAYPLTAAGDSVAPYGLEFDVRQGSRNPSGYPAARKQITASTTSAAIVAGEFSLLARLGTGSAIDADDKYDARWIRFESGASGLPQGFAYKILDTEDDAGGDGVILGDRGGVRTAIPSGSDFYIDYGWATGDPFFVLRPVTITSATAAESDSPVRLDGTATISLAVIRQVAQIGLTSPSGVVSLEHVYIHDLGSLTGLPIANCGEIGLCLTGTTTQVASFRNISLVGGGTGVANNDQKMHGLALQSGYVGPIPALDGFTTRYLGDDNIVTLAAPTGSRTWSRIHAAFRNDQADGVGDSAQCLDFASAPVAGWDFDDVICDDVASPGDSVIGNLGNASAGNTSAVHTIRNLTAWANRGMTAVLGQRTNFENLLVVGAENVTGSGGTFVPPRASRFVVRDNRSTDANAAVTLGLSVRWDNGVIARNTLGFTDAAIATAVQDGAIFTSGVGVGVKNVALLDNAWTGACTAGGTCSAFSISNILTAGFVRRYERMTIAETFGQTPADTARGFNVSGTDFTGTFVGGIALAGITAASSLAYFAVAPVLDGTADAINLGSSEARAICTFNNNDDNAAHFTSNLTTHPGSLMDLDPGFVDPWSGNFALLPGSRGALAGCGADGKAGLLRPSANLSASGMPAETLDGSRIYVRGAGGGGSVIPRAFP